MREELNVLLQNERTARLNAERRERYWRGKFDSEAVELEDDDHRDLSQMLTNVPKEKVPEEMLCMWKQQKKNARNKKQTRISMAPKVSTSVIHMTREIVESRSRKNK